MRFAAEGYWIDEVNVLYSDVLDDEVSQSAVSDDVEHVFLELVFLVELVLKWQAKRLVSILVNR